MVDDARLWEIFLDVQRGLPRQGPGADESTLRALALCGALPERPAVLDIGCGPGMQTLALARALDGRIAAIDVFPEYLNALKARAAEAAPASRIDVIAADMNALPFPDSSVDLIWSEGAAYIMGVETAMTQWRPFLKSGGVLAITELVWLRPNPPEEAAAFFGAEYPAMTDIETIERRLAAAGYEPLAHFTLPDAAWWDHYYTPLEAKLPALRTKFAGDDEALGIVEATQREIDIRPRHGDSYGYAFFIGRKNGRS